MFRIGILQLTQNLDDAVRGFKSGLETLGVAAEFQYVNADGNVEVLPILAKKLADAGVQLIFACSTPAARAANDLPGEIPVLFTPVFDPVAAKLLRQPTCPEGKITGMSGMVDAGLKLQFIAELLPDLKKLGVLYHTGDENACIEMRCLRKAAEGRVELAEIAIAGQEDLSLLEEKLPSDIDALFLPIGKIVEDNFSTVAYYTDAIGLPIIASHTPNVSLGAIGALVANHVKLGEACAAQAKAILVDRRPISEVPVGYIDTPEILLNGFVADNLGRTLPQPLVEKSDILYF